MSEPSSTDDGGPGEAVDPTGDPTVVDDGPSDLVRFLLVGLAAVIVIAAVFLIVRARQDANADDKYRACLEQAAQKDNPEGFRPEDFCQKPG